MPRFLLSLVFFALSACQAGTDPDKVSLDFARSQLEAGLVTMIDIRETAEHRSGVAQGAVLLPMSELPGKLGQIPMQPDKPVLLICNTQNRSRATLAELKKRGYQNIHYVEGGMSGWAAKAWPMVRPKP